MRAVPVRTGDVIGSLHHFEHDVLAHALQTKIFKTRISEAQLQTVPVRAGDVIGPLHYFKHDVLAHALDTNKKY